MNQFDDGCLTQADVGEIATSVTVHFVANFPTTHPLASYSFPSLYCAIGYVPLLCLISGACNEILCSRKSYPLLTRRAAATYLGLSPITLAIWRSTKRYGLPVVKIGRTVRYRQSDLDEFINKRVIDLIRTPESCT